MSKTVHAAAQALNLSLPVLAFACGIVQGIADQNAFIALKGLGLAVLFGLNCWGIKK
jgi:hypothetical protein